jgi:hypothetical protein
MTVADKEETTMEKHNNNHSPGYDGGTCRVFGQFMWLQIGCGKTAFPHPAHPTRCTGYPAGTMSSRGNAGCWAVDKQKVLTTSQ